MLNLVVYIVTSDRWMVNLSKTKRNLLYIRNQAVPRSKLSITVIKTNQLMAYKAKVAVCSDIRTKQRKVSAM